MTKTPEEHRKHIEKTAKEVRNARITSGHRDDSAAHRRGAIDIASKGLTKKERHNEAREISEKLGREYRVVVEEVRGDRQTNTTYEGGEKGRTRDNVRKATETHTHIQPNKKPQR